MQIKKTAIVTVFVLAIFVSANFMVAKAYEPLVRIPGLPADGPINLSQYVVGLYNFLLSIVGIVAVMMLIIGGMKYIAAAGNASVISDAKDTIWNAILGLLLALLSWVIVSTINPDVLYIKQPASSLIGNEFENDLGVCGVYDGAVCTCKDGTTPFAVDKADCETACADNCGTTEGSPCILRGSFSSPVKNANGDLSCSCFDGNKNVVLSAAAIVANAQCNEVCINPAWAVDGEYHGISWDLEVGNSVGGLVSAGKTTVYLNEVIYYDFTKVRDCRGKMIHLAVNFEAGPDPGPLDILTVRACCLAYNSPACGIGVWAALCDTPLGIPLGIITLCEEETGGLKPGTDIFPPPNGTDYPIYKHTYTSVGLKHVWVGSSYRDVNGICQDLPDPSHLFEIDVVPVLVP